ncbi:unnamed protein product, partial [Dibothriocephalus latus]
MGELAVLEGVVAGSGLVSGAPKVVQARETFYYQQPTAVCFVDFAAAFDPILRESLWRIMELDGVP